MMLDRATDLFYSLIAGQIRLSVEFYHSETIVFTNDVRFDIIVLTTIDRKSIKRG